MHRGTVAPAAALCGEASNQETSQMADSEDTAAKANDAAHAAAGTVTQAARSARSSARRTGSRARARSRARSAAL
jgi:hypothetical protein